MLRRSTHDVGSAPRTARVRRPRIPGVDRSLGVPATKILVPPVPARLVHRERLFARLDRGMSGALTLVSAPPGSGKTTLVVDWLHARSAAPVAWVSLDAADNDPAQFVRVLVAALRTLMPKIGETALETMREPMRVFPRPMLAGLVNEVLTAPRDVIVVFENYHVIREPALHDAVEYLVSRRPEQLHIVITTREDPPLRLAHLRAKGMLTEVRSAHLHFTAEEGTEFLRGVMELPLSGEEAAALHARTDGWAAALQLAAVSMRSGAEIGGVLAGFEGGRRYVVEYLAEEVLGRQPAAVQTFLLRTSVLDRLNAPLCDAVLADQTPAGGARAMLERLERANLFLTPLDEARRWFGYHQLFAEFLRSELERVEPGIVPLLHERASRWCGERGLIEDATRHALAVPDFHGAARLMERRAMIAVHLGEQQTVLGWLRALPDEVVQAHPLLCVAGAWALYMGNQMESVERYLGLAERYDPSTTTREDAAFIDGRVKLLRATMYIVRGDPERSMRLAGEALPVLPASDAPGRALAGFVAQQITGDVRPDKERAFAAAVQQARVAGLGVVSRIALARLAQFYVLQGRLRRAATAYEEARRALNLDVVTGLPTYCFGRGDLLREWNELEEAERLLMRGTVAITEANTVTPQVVVDGYVALARLRQVRDDAHGAAGALSEFVALARRRDFPESVLARASAARAQLWLAQGNLAAAAHWADTSGLDCDDEPSYRQELEHLALARVRAAQGRRPALVLLDRLLAEAEAFARVGSAIHILVARALARQAFGERTGALADLERALGLGEPEGYVRVFADGGPLMAGLLRGARASGIAPEYAAALLSIVEPRPATPALREATSPVRTVEPFGRDHADDVLVETLTERELAILRLIASGASNQEIASTLFLATSTVKWHVHHIFGKLGVRSRTQAIVRAKALAIE